jgi:hypothetical protein
VNTQLLKLASQWHDEAKALRRRGADPQALVLESCAEELERAEMEYGLEALTLQEAERESGYSYSALQKIVASNRLLNVGSKHSPRIRRGDLPRKARARELPVRLFLKETQEPDLVEAVLAGR